MSLTDILKKIEAEAQVEIDKINAQMAKDKKAIEAESVETQKVEAKALEHKIEEALKSVDDKTASMARRKNGELILTTKRGLIDKAMQGLLTSLEGADDKLYTDIVKALVAGLPFTEGTLKVPANREALMKSLAGNLKLVTDKNIKGGFVATGQGTEVDNTFASLVFSEYRAELEMHFANQLKLV